MGNACTTSCSDVTRLERLITKRQSHKIEAWLNRKYHRTSKKRVRFILAVVRKGNDDVMNYIMRYVGVDCTDEKGRTALWWAVHKRDILAVKFLLAYTPNVDLADASEVTPLMEASRLGRHDIVEILVQAGADVGKADSNGVNALMIATERGDSKVAEVLCRSSTCDVNAGNSQRETPLMRASECGHEEVVGVLLENGCDVNAVDSLGDSAVTRASRRGHKRIAKRISEYEQRASVGGLMRRTASVCGSSARTASVGGVCSVAVCAGGASHGGENVGGLCQYMASTGGSSHSLATSDGSCSRRNSSVGGLCDPAASTGGSNHSLGTSGGSCSRRNSSVGGLCDPTASTGVSNPDIKSSDGLCAIPAHVDDASPKLENNADSHTCVECNSTHQLNTVLTSSVQHDLDLPIQHPGPIADPHPHHDTVTALVSQTIEKVPSPCHVISSNIINNSSACDQSNDRLTNGQVDTAGDNVGQQLKESQASDTERLLALPVDTSTDAEIDVCGQESEEGNEQCKQKKTIEIKDWPYPKTFPARSLPKWADESSTAPSSQARKEDKAQQTTPLISSDDNEFGAKQNKQRKPREKRKCKNKCRITKKVYFVTPDPSSGFTINVNNATYLCVGSQTNTDVTLSDYSGDSESSCDASEDSGDSDSSCDASDEDLMNAT